MLKLLVLQGVPASGKSTFAKQLAHEDKSYVVVNRDSIRNMSGDYWLPEREEYISSVEYFCVTSALARGYNVIVDATNLNPITIDKWKSVSEKYHAKITYKMFDISFEDAVARDKLRPKPVGEKVIKSFFMKYLPHKILKYNDDRLISLPDYGLPNVYLCDIDGTLALRVNRSPYDFTTVKNDVFDPRMKQVLKNLPKDSQIIFMSGRDGTPQCRKDTEDWLKSNLEMSDIVLLMRTPGDRRGDEIVKKELYNNHIKHRFNVVCVFDDRDKVVKMWRDEGLLCCQVYYGNF